MKKIAIIIIIGIIIVGSTILTNTLSENGLRFISNIGVLVSLSGTIITLILALILYNQLGLDQAILQKKAEVVFTLLNMLNERSFEIKTNLEANPFIWLTSIKKYKADHQKYHGEIKLLFNKDYVYCILPIINLIENIFLPTELLPKIQALAPTVFISDKSKINLPEYGKVVVHGNVSSSDNPSVIVSNLDHNDWGLLAFGSSSSSEITLSRFLEEWDDLITAVTQWMAHNSSYQDLNIPFFRKHDLQLPRSPMWRRVWDWLMTDAF